MNASENIGFNYCITHAGRNCGPFENMGESLWFPTINEEAKTVNVWPHIDERHLGSRCRHELEEFHKSHGLNKKKASALIVGAGFFGEEWGTEIEHLVPITPLTIIEGLPRAMGPLLDSAAEHWPAHRNGCGFKEFYSCLDEPLKDEIWQRIELPSKADVKYICIDEKASIDERLLVSRRRHELEEFHGLHDLNKQKASGLIVGSALLVEWATKIEYFCPNIPL